MRILVFVFACCAAALLRGESIGPAPGAMVVLTDGQVFFPTGSVPSKASVDALHARSLAIEFRAAQCETNTADALAVAMQSRDAVAFVSASNIVHVQSYVGSVGSNASTNQLVNILSFSTQGYPATNLHFEVAFSAPQTTVPGLDWRMTLSASGSSSNDWTSVTNSVCSWPTQVVHPSTPAGWFAYGFDLPVSGLGGSAFFRVVSHAGGGAGTGWYLLVYNFLSVNGRRGRTATILDDEGNALEFMGGPLVEPLE